MILTIYNWSRPKLFSGISQKTHPGVTIGTQTKKKGKCGNYYTPNFLSKTLYFVNNDKNGSA